MSDAVGDVASRGPPVLRSDNGLILQKRYRSRRQARRPYARGSWGLPSANAAMADLGSMPGYDGKAGP